MPYSDKTGPLDASELESFIKYYGEFIKRLPAIKTQAIYAAGKVLQDEVRDQINKQGVHDLFGRVNRWQQLSLGSKGGYARVKSICESTDSSWNGSSVSSSQITAWLERGHATRRPSGRVERYKPRIKSAIIGKTGAVVKGKMFYSWARFYGERKALDAAERELDRITDEWEWE